MTHRVTKHFAGCYRFRGFDFHRGEHGYWHVEWMGEGEPPFEVDHWYTDTKAGMVSGLKAEFAALVGREVK